MAYEAEPFLEVVSDFGEGPLWHAASRTLYWIDGTPRLIWRHAMAESRTESVSLSGFPGSVAICGDGSLLVAFRNRLSRLDFATGAEIPVPVPVDFAGERFNDGKCDRAGRFFVGSFDRTQENPTAGLYRYTSAAGMQKVAGGVTLSNGIAWSPDGTRMYHCESRPGYLYAYDYDMATGEPANRHILVDFRPRGCIPDGCTVDAGGGIWVAEIGAGRVTRFSPQGEPQQTIGLPVSKPTSLIFGGDDLSTLYITTMRHGLDEAALAAEPLAGRLFAARPGMAGLAEPMFGG